jgi:hypothetical protein
VLGLRSRECPGLARRDKVWRVAAIDVPPDPSFGLRTGPKRPEWPRSDLERKRSEDLSLLTGALALTCIGAGTGLVWLFRRRSTIARAADDAVIRGGAKALKVKRRTIGSFKRLLQRIRERADAG